MGNEIKQKSKLTIQQLDQCILHVLRLPELFNYAQQHLKPVDFDRYSETWYGLLWASALSVAENNGGLLPTKGLESIIATELLSKVEKSNSEVSQEVVDVTLRLLNWIFSVPEDQLNAQYYKPVIRDLIVERTIIGNLSKDVNAFKEQGTPTDLISRMDTYSKKMQSIVTDNDLGQTAFPKEFKPKKLGKFSTGLPWIDDFMNGGHAASEVYTILGPSGLGKTTKGIMITVESALVWSKVWSDKLIPRPKVSCFFSWEQDLERLRHRFWSYAARIDSAVLENVAEGNEALSTTGNLKAYELEEFKDFIQVNGPAACPGESERLSAAIAQLGDITRIFDFSGSAENPAVGNGGLDEVAAALASLTREGYDIGCVVLDYAGIAVRKYISAKGYRPETQRYHLANFCNDCRFKIAIPYNCPVWALHQLNTEANRRSPTADQHHSYASEAGNFSENAWFAFVFSTKDKINNTCRLFCTKERRSKGDTPPVLLKIEGNFCRMVDARNTHQVVETMRQIMPRAQADKRIDPTEFRKRQGRDMPPGYSDIGDY